jgi:hypothetical protein
MDFRESRFKNMNLKNKVKKIDYQTDNNNEKLDTEKLPILKLLKQNKKNKKIDDYFVNVKKNVNLKKK